MSLGLTERQLSATHCSTSENAEVGADAESTWRGGVPQHPTSHVAALRSPSEVALLPGFLTSDGFNLIPSPQAVTFLFGRLRVPLLGRPHGRVPTLRRASLPCERDRGGHSLDLSTSWVVTQRLHRRSPDRV